MQIEIPAATDYSINAGGIHLDRQKETRGALTTNERLKTEPQRATQTKEGQSDTHKIFVREEEDRKSVV